MADRPLRVDADDRLRSGGNPKRGGRKPPARRKSRGVLGSLLKFAVLVFLWVGIVGGGVLGYFALTLPDTSQLAVAERRPSVTVLAADGSLIASFGDLFGQPLSLREMSPYLPKAVIATEDRRFYSHFGVDPIGTLARRGGQFPRRPCRPGRQHDHPAARQDPVPDARSATSRARSARRCWRCGSSTASPRTRSSKSI